MSATGIPNKTRAAQFSKNGGPEVVEVVEIDTPTAKPDEVLVKIEWGGVNFIDIYVREGVYPTPSFPRGVGQEVSGVIVALPTSGEVLEDAGFKKRNLKIGDKVVTHGGAYARFAEYAAIPWDKAIPVPANISTRLAAASFVQGLTALTFVYEAYAVQKGDYILIQAVAGGFGLQLTQIVKKLGGIVIGTTSTPEKAELAKQYGADHVILYTKGNVADEVLKITGGVGVHATFDGIGKDTWEDNFKVVRRKGTIVTMGNTSGVVPPFAPLRLVAKNLKVTRPTVANYIYTIEEADHYSALYWKLLDEGLKVPIHKEYPFTAEGIREAQTDLKGRGTTGKLLINVAGSSS